jgi:nitroreductase
MDAADQALNALREHRSIRRYAAEPIPADDVERMMGVALRASSGGLGQLYSVIRVRDAGLRAQLAETAGQAHIAALLALANLGTAAEIMGYGICYVGSIQRVLEQVIALLRLPAGVCPLLGLCVGVPDETPPLAPRLPLDIVFHDNYYREPQAADLERCYEAMAAVTYGGGWFESLSQHFTAGQEYEEREARWRRALEGQGMGPQR